MKTTIITSCLVAVFLIISCTDSKPTYQKSPLDNIITEHLNDPNYSVLLADMDYQEAQDQYLHKYQIIIAKDSTFVDPETKKDTTILDLKNETTDWKEVSPAFFEKNVDNLGMTVLSKQDGVLDKEASPAGYDQYVGNEKYGRWERDSSGNSFWAFYGQYALLSHLFYPGYRYSYSSWNDYDRNYRGRGSYYGSGSNKYGTKSSHNKSSNWNKKPNTFKEKVRSRVSRSSRSSSTSRSSRTSRSSSRYSGSSSRSRGGGSGK